ncbi:PTS glucitol/sorbitol transporter subunit IIA [Planococcus sp. N028]|uniref:PTS glucitol/sorbitol transporter subunit IIA n=1 Tax=Planococcus shixiaomingii TaxID=3058393 RepID=A0ABT8MZY0_9BACL|nr:MULTISPECIES: PTS glucitol/sorbitol transporter subunit IIA [unclassified Planococcus (in: firmicutes)]MDN7241165.1 PTS glucitol/sorbitol transporter subunit IIA [Planococcus sp. N028]WKA53418.1 PTS glucitol/sorbitol transporter subunit IIA [Planococcus sp. N022]
MIKKYESKITEIGADVEMFVEEHMLVIFNETVPDALKSFGVIHEKAELFGQVEAGDILEINGARYNILFVGEKVNETLREIGHCTIAFNGERDAQLPGTMCVEKKELPPLAVNGDIRIVKA